jgi:hypothetical protein
VQTTCLIKTRSRPHSLRMRFISALFGLFACISCGGTSGSSIGSGTGTTQPAHDVSGSWTGTVTSISGYRGTFDAELHQNGATVTGSIHLATGCAPGGKLDGTVSGDSFDGSFVAGAVTATMTATIVSDDELDGTYVLPGGGACPDDRGSFSMRK